MLTKVTAYNPETDLDPLVFNIINRPETDLFEVRNIDGLEAVTANVNTTQLGSINKEAFTGTSSGKRNIVMTLGLDPDWDEWTISRLRRLLDRYFMPHSQSRLVFESTEFSPVEIFGYVESNAPNMFSKDPEHPISIICPDPDFISVDPITIHGSTDMDPLDIDYQGNLPAGFNVIVQTSADADPEIISIYNTYQDLETFVVQPGEAFPLDSTHSFMMNSIPGNKFVKLVGGVGPGPNYLNSVQVPYVWPKFRQGINTFQVLTNIGVHPWVLTYYEHFGSL